MRAQSGERYEHLLSNLKNHRGSHPRHLNWAQRFSLSDRGRAGCAELLTLYKLLVTCSHVRWSKAHGNSGPIWQVVCTTSGRRGHLNHPFQLLPQLHPPLHPSPWPVGFEALVPLSQGHGLTCVRPKAGRRALVRPVPAPNSQGHVTSPPSVATRLYHFLATVAIDRTWKTMLPQELERIL